jgi:hypothetical protein
MEQAMTMVFVCGLYNVAFAIFHLLFWKLFGWQQDLARLTWANRGIVQILNIQLTYFFLFVAFVCFAFPEELLTTRLGSAFLLGNALFWLVRAVQQVVFLRRNHWAVWVLEVVFLVGMVLFGWVGFA